jgi:hypothetical protein
MADYDDEEYVRTYISDEEKIVQSYLKDNAIYHIYHEIQMHSWPCIIWLRGEFPANPGCSWELLRNHGLVPENFCLMTS